MGPGGKTGLDVRRCLVLLFYPRFVRADQHLGYVDLGRGFVGKNARKNLCKIAPSCVLPPCRHDVIPQGGKLAREREGKMGRGDFKKV